MSDKTLLLKQIQSKIDEKLKKCKSVKDFVDLVFSFEFQNHTIMPIQIKNEIEKLITILNVLKPKTIVEIGTANGGTLFLLCKVAARKNAKIISIDLPEGPFGGDLYPKWKEPLYSSFAKKDQKLYLIRANSHEPTTLTKIKKLLGDEKIDFLLIDGDHSFQGVKQDFEMFSDLVSSEGIIAFHDVKPGPEQEVGGVPNFWKIISKKYPSLEIIDDYGRQNSYGIGLLISNFKLFPSTYIKVAKSLTNIQKSEINKLKDQFHLTNLTVQQKDKQLKNLKDKLHKTNLTVQQKDKQLKNLKDELYKTNLTVQQKDKQITNQDKMIQKKDKQLKNLKDELHKTNLTVQQKDKQISNLLNVNCMNF